MSRLLLHIEIQLGCLRFILYENADLTSHGFPDDIEVVGGVHGELPTI